MSKKLTEVQNDVIKDIARKEGFKSYEIFVTSGSNKGDGFLGIITSVKIKGDKGVLNLILKSAHVNDVLRKKAPVVEAYQREIFLYQEVFPAFREFQKEYNVSDSFSAYAKLYGSSSIENNECIILENLKELNYKLWNKQVPMNSEHLSSVMVEYGKLHANSLAMKIRKPEIYKQLTEKLEKIFILGNDENLWEHITKSITRNGLKAVEGNHMATETVQKLMANLQNFYSKSFSVLEDRLVILHGDCWNNNMMFHYEECQSDVDHTLKPNKVCLLDWQLSRVGSPVLDLSYFLFVCASKEDLDQYRKYLELYHTTVADELSKFSCDVEDVFPYALLESHWKKYSRFGVFMAIVILKIMLSEGDEIPDIENIGKRDKEKTGKAPLDIVNVDEYKRRVLDIVTFISDNKFI